MLRYHGYKSSAKTPCSLKVIAANPDRCRAQRKTVAIKGIFAVVIRTEKVSFFAALHLPRGHGALYLKVSVRDENF